MSPHARRAVFATTSAALLLLGRVGHAQVSESDIAERVVSHPHTIAILEAGVIALPNAAISSAQRGGNTPFIGTIGKGDATEMLGIHVLYRGGRDWAIGAGALFGPNPTSDSNYGAGSGIPRTHSRSYLTLGTEARYVPLHIRWFEGWVGLTAGAVIIADRFSSDTGDPVPPILGTRESTVRTEGLAFGVEGGFDWMFADRWVAGFAVRADQWILPNDPQCSPIRDCATLTGSVTALELGLTIGYRLPL